MVKIPLIRENGQEPKRSAKKTYQAPQAKKVRVTSKKEKFFRTTFENLILIYIRSI
ncbi:TPA: hypothetical protein ACHA1K_002780 [Enterococcus faecium]|uniref:Uncharacterized protein n=1 Tax=Enterococcus faecium TaxID=1352 RepID=A0A1W6ASI8_ENTFC|nr:hypothetical protein [Enterococcus faecium]ARJ34093.1 hypothetical protein [Enterococcus faecium]EKC6695105.1 hypothetical protein [Enterococcus faecium]MBG8216946.1 hypothetical protein [Enterococcus faecium]MBG8285497.1 hypothetical protein [Enterococcus faecium]MBK1371344.1 hypothetical protein [Enterococcus faecium]